MKMSFELKVVELDDHGNYKSVREPTDEEVRLFKEKFEQIEELAENKYNGLLWLLDETISEEQFDFTYPNKEGEHDAGEWEIDNEGD